jgi:hypothetical protein
MRLLEERQHRHEDAGVAECLQIEAVIGLHRKELAGEVAVHAAAPLVECDSKGQRFVDLRVAARRVAVLVLAVDGEGRARIEPLQQPGDVDIQRRPDDGGGLGRGVDARLDLGGAAATLQHHGLLVVGAREGHEVVLGIEDPEPLGDLGDGVVLAGAEQRRLADALRVRLHLALHLACELAPLLRPQPQRHAALAGPVAQLRQRLLAQPRRLQRLAQRRHGAVHQKLGEQVLVAVFVPHISSVARPALVLQDRFHSLQRRIHARPKQRLVERLHCCAAAKLR